MVVVGFSDMLASALLGAQRTRREGFRDATAAVGFSGLLASVEGVSLAAVGAQAGNTVRLDMAGAMAGRLPGGALGAFGAS